MAKCYPPPSKGTRKCSLGGLICSSPVSHRQQNLIINVELTANPLLTAKPQANAGRVGGLLP